MSAVSGVTVGVMARAPVPGRCKTRLIPLLGRAGAAELYQAMLLDSLDAYARTGASRFVVMAAPEDEGAAALRALVPATWEVIAQRGDGLGERLADALAVLGADGDAVALVSSDSPTIDPVSIAVAFERLARGSHAHRALLGACVDGGYYLIALTTPDAGVFRDVPWSTAAVADTTRARCRELGLALEELPVALDVDEPDDVARLRAELRGHSRAPRTARVLA